MAETETSPDSAGTEKCQPDTRTHWVLTATKLIAQRATVKAHEGLEPRLACYSIDSATSRMREGQQIRFLGTGDDRMAADD